MEMEFLYEKVAYLKGLADGLDIDESTKEGRLLISIIDILEDFADAIVELDEGAEEITEYVEAMDEDLANVEDDFYEDDIYEDEDDENDEIDFVEIECPNCHEDVYIDEDLLYEDDVDVVCPRCHEIVDFGEIEDYHHDDDTEEDE
jgi:phage FluMu protein Com